METKDYDPSWQQMWQHNIWNMDVGIHSQLCPCSWNTNWPLYLNYLLGQRIEESNCVQRTSINGRTLSNRRRNSTRPWLKINLPFELWLVFLWTISALSKCKTEVHSQTVISAKEEVWVVVVLTAQRELLWLTSFVVTGSATATCLRVHQCSPLKDLHQDPDNTKCWWEHYLIRSLIKVFYVAFFRQNSILTNMYACGTSKFYLLRVLISCLKVYFCWEKLLCINKADSKFKERAVSDVLC